MTYKTEYRQGALVPAMFPGSDNQSEEFYLSFNFTLTKWGEQLTQLLRLF